MPPIPANVKQLWKRSKELFECAVWAFAQVLYTTLPLIVLFGVTALLGGDDMLTVFGGSEALFVVVIAFIDGARDSLRGISLQAERIDTGKQDTVVIATTILVVMSVLTLALSIAIDKNVIAISPMRHRGFELLIKNMLAMALVWSAIIKFQLKRVEDKMSKAAHLARPSSQRRYQDKNGIVRHECLSGAHCEPLEIDLANGVRMNSNTVQIQYLEPATQIVHHLEATLEEANQIAATNPKYVKPITIMLPDTDGRIDFDGAGGVMIARPDPTAPSGKGVKYTSTTAAILVAAANEALDA